MNSFYYNQQLKRYLVQFMYIFSGMQVRVGKTSTREAGLIDVPVHYSSMDKVAASISAGNTSNKPIRIPAMSASLQTLRKMAVSPGLNQEYSSTYLPAGGYFANDVKTITRLKPTQYNATVNLAIWTSNVDQQFQLLEQILTIFNPSIQIQTSDGPFDWTKITMVELVDIQYQESYPINTLIRMPIAELTFEMPIYLSAPVEIRDSFVRDIFVRLGTLGDDTDISNLVQEFDDESLQYERFASADDIVDRIKKSQQNDTAQ